MQVRPEGARGWDWNHSGGSTPLLCSPQETHVPPGRAHQDSVTPHLSQRSVETAQCPATWGSRAGHMELTEGAAPAATLAL